MSGTFRPEADHRRSRLRSEWVRGGTLPTVRKLKHGGAWATCSHCTWLTMTTGASSFDRAQVARDRLAELDEAAIPWRGVRPGEA